MKKKITAVALVAALSLGLFGCGGNTTDKSSAPAASTASATTNAVAGGEAAQKVTINLGAAPKTIDPILQSEVIAQYIDGNVFEGLVRFEEGDKVVPGIAESWEISEDGLTYTFHLRDAKWSDGQPLTAEDYMKSWRHAIDPKTAADQAYMMYFIKNAQEIAKGTKPVEELAVEAPDSKTLVVHLNNPTPFFLELMNYHLYYPIRMDMVEKSPEGWATKPETFIGNGPFKMKDYKLQDSIILVKNEHYYDPDAVKLDQITFVMISQQSTAFASFQAGDIDFTTAPGPQIPQLIEQKNPDLKIFPMYGTYFLAFNNKLAPFDNPKVRKAFSLVLNREALVTTVSKGGQEPAVGYVPKGTILSDGRDFREVEGNNGISLTGNVEEAKKLLAEAGYPDGKGFPKVEYTYNTSELHQQMAEAMQGMWKQHLGVDVGLKNEEWAVFIDSRQQHNFQIARHGWIGSYKDPMVFLDMWISGGSQNDADYSNPKYDELMNIALTKQGKERDEALVAAEKLLIEEEGAISPIFHYTDPYMIRSSFKNYIYSPLGSLFLREAYMEKK